MHTEGVLFAYRGSIFNDVTLCHRHHHLIITQMDGLTRTYFLLLRHHFIGTTRCTVDQYQIWCYLADPFSREFPYPLFIENEAAVEQAMFDFFLPLPTNTGTPENIVEIERITALRHAVKEDYLNYKTQMGVWQSIFTQTRPEAKTEKKKKNLY